MKLNPVGSRTKHQLFAETDPEQIPADWIVAALKKSAKIVGLPDYTPHGYTTEVKAMRKVTLHDDGTFTVRYNGGLRRVLPALWVGLQLPRYLVFVYQETLGRLDED